MNKLKENLSLGLNLSMLPFGKNLISFRWAFLIFLMPIFYLLSDQVISHEWFFKFFIVTFIYNFLATLYILKRQERSKPINENLFFVDIVLVSTFSMLLGGIKSEIFVILFFVMASFDISNDIVKMLKTSAICILIYATSCFIVDIKNLSTFEYTSLLSRSLFILLATYGISLLTTKVEKYDALHKREFKMARTDKLTGLPNRHYLEQKLKEEIEIADLTKKPFNILMFDLDNFKKFNDSYGHVWGDKLLSIFSDIMTQNIRKIDIPARYGGEEFILIVKDVDLQMAKCVGNRVRKQLEKQKIYVGQGEERTRVTVSCGIAQYPTHSEDIKTVIDLADKSLYHGKGFGKNIVVGYDELLNYEKNNEVM